MFRKILWKEWKENLWKLLFCGSVSAVFTIMLFRIRIIPDSPNCLIISLIQMFIIPIVYSLDIFSGEISNRTIYLLFKVPVPRWMIFFSKFIVSAFGIVVIFLMSSILMEVMAQGRETPILYLSGINLLFGAVALLLFTWFCPFGCQTRSEAGSLAILFSVFIGWAIVFAWAWACDVTWAKCIVPYSFIIVLNGNMNLAWAATAQIPLFILALVIACYRYVSIRRYL